MSFPLGLSGSVLPCYVRVYLLRRLATCDLLVREQGNLGAVGVLQLDWGFQTQKLSHFWVGHLHLSSKIPQLTLDSRIDVTLHF